jgi:hypothetical protein
MKETLDKIKSRKQEVEIKIQEILSEFNQEVLEISDNQTSLSDVSASKIEIRDINGRDNSQFRIELKIGMNL